MAAMAAAPMHIMRGRKVHFYSPGMSSLRTSSDLAGTKLEENMTAPESSANFQEAFNPKSTSILSASSSNSSDEYGWYYILRSHVVTSKRSKLMIATEAKQ